MTAFTPAIHTSNAPSRRRKGARFTSAACAMALTLASYGPSSTAYAAGGDSGLKVVSFTTRHYGDDAGATFGRFPHPTKVFVGNDFTYDAFALPDLDPSKGAVVMMRTMNVNHDRNVFQVNGRDIFNGAINGHPGRLDDWFTQMVEIPSGFLIGNTEDGAINPVNTITIRSLADDGSLSGGIDDFLVDSVVVIYTRK